VRKEKGHCATHCPTKSKQTKHLRLFGNADTVKLDKNHYGNVYCMWNQVTAHVDITRNIIWMKQMMFQKQVEEDEVQILPDVEVAIVEWRIQDVVAPQEAPAPEVELVGGQETSDK